MCYYFGPLRNALTASAVRLCEFQHPDAPASNHLANGMKPVKDSENLDMDSKTRNCESGMAHGS
jgi:hypothetical protein